MVEDALLQGYLASIPTRVEAQVQSPFLLHLEIIACAKPATEAVTFAGGYIARPERTEAAHAAPALTSVGWQELNQNDAKEDCPLAAPVLADVVANPYKSRASARSTSRIAG